MDGEPTARVLYVGWYGDAVGALARHGAETTCVVSAADAAAATAHPACARVVVVPDPERVDDVVGGLLRDGVDVRDFDRVCTEHEQAIVPTAVLAEAYGRPGLPVPTAVALRDKLVQKRLVRDAGVPVAGCRTAIGVDELAGQPRPFVVKPFDGGGSRLTYAVTDDATLRAAVGGIAASGESGPWLVEDFMPGTELHLDGVVRDGTVTFLSVSRYLDNVIHLHRGSATGSVVLHPQTHRELYARAHELTSASIEALGHTDGVFHLEAFDHEGTLSFSECAGRIAGGLLWEAVIAKFGVDLYDEWARAVLGLPGGGTTGRALTRDAFGWVHLSAPAGRVASIPTAEDLEARPGVVLAQVHFAPGDTIPDLSTASHLRAARVLLTGNDEQTVADGLREAVRWFPAQVRIAA